MDTTTDTNDTISADWWIDATSNVVWPAEDVSPEQRELPLWHPVRLVTEIKVSVPRDSDPFDPMTAFNQLYYVTEDDGHRPRRCQPGGERWYCLWERLDWPVLHPEH